MKKTKPHLALLTYSMAGGGTERVLSQWIPHLMERYRVHLVLMRRQIDYPLPDDLPIHFLENSHPAERGWKKVAKLPFLAYRFNRFCRRHNIDLAVSFLFRPNYINVLARRMGSGVKTVISERINPSGQYGGGSLTDWVSNWLIKHLYPWADRLVVNSHGIAWDLQENYGYRRAIDVVYNPLSTDTIEERARCDVSLPGEPLRVAFCGRLHWQKRVDTLIKALPLIEAPLHLLIMGKGPEENRLRDLVRKHRMESRVHFMGFVENPFAVVARCDMLVLPSSHEGFPNVLLEALACGTPVVATDCLSGPREILAPGTEGRPHLKSGYECEAYGVLVPVGDAKSMAKALERLVEDSDLREEYRRQGRHRARDFDSASFVQQYDEILKSALRG